MTLNTGILYIVSTPIGNLADMSPRALKTLKEVNLIAAEDTRHSKKLLEHFAISTPLISFHEHNERERSPELLEQLQKGKSVALICDAGTPLINDPGYRLVFMARRAGISISPIPGPCAAITALSASGLPADHFVFEGFLPVKTASRLGRLKELSDETRTLIFYEAPHRILDLFKDMMTIFEKDRQVVLARELTKMFETIYGDTLIQVYDWLQNQPQQIRGEFVILVEGTKDKLTQTKQNEKILEILLEELPVKQAAGLAAKITGEKKNTLYQWALEMKSK